MRPPRRSRAIPRARRAAFRHYADAGESTQGGRTLLDSGSSRGGRHGPRRTRRPPDPRPPPPPVEPRRVLAEVRRAREAPEPARGRAMGAVVVQRAAVVVLRGDEGRARRPPQD